MTIDALIRRMKSEAKATGSQEAYAKKLDVSPQYLSEVLRGVKEPGPGILRPLGLVRRVEYFARLSK